MSGGWFVFGFYRFASITTKTRLAGNVNLASWPDFCILLPLLSTLYRLLLATYYMGFTSRSPRWSILFSGNPRMLLLTLLIALVLEFESHRREILNIVAKISTAEGAKRG